MSASAIKNPEQFDAQHLRGYLALLAAENRELRAYAFELLKSQADALSKAERYQKAYEFEHERADKQSALAAEWARRYREISEGKKEGCLTDGTGFKHCCKCFKSHDDERCCIHDVTK